MCLDPNLIPCTDAGVNLLVSARHTFTAKQQSSTKVTTQGMFSSNALFVTWNCQD